MLTIAFILELTTTAAQVYCPSENMNSTMGGVSAGAGGGDDVSAAVGIGFDPVVLTQFDFFDTRDKTDSIKAVNAVAIILIGTITAARILVRWLMVRNFGLDDILMIFATAMGIAFCSMCLLGTISLSLIHPLDPLHRISPSAEF
jgi:hypothetical protein